MNTTTEMNAALSPEFDMSDAHRAAFDQISIFAAEVLVDLKALLETATSAQLPTLAIVAAKVKSIGFEADSTDTSAGADIADIWCLRASADLGFSPED